MERINGFSIYQLGQIFSKVTAFDNDVSKHDCLLPLIQADRAAKDLLTGDPIPVGVSKTRVQAVVDRIKWVMDQYFKRENAQGVKEFFYPGPDDETRIPSWVWSSLKTTVKELETVLSDEMREMATYYVPRRGIFWTPALVDNAHEGFPDEVRGHVPQKTCDDWKAAGRCLAFNLLTASGFHAARAVEGTLELYYQLFSGKPDKTLRSWDDYIKALQKIIETGSSPAPLSKTLSELDQMRTYDRNPIMHPRIVLSESDAHILFSSSQSLIIAMAQEIKQLREAGGAQAGLALHVDAF